MIGKTSEANFDGGLCLSQDCVSGTGDEALPCRLHKIGNYITLNIVTCNGRALQEKGTVY